jgi:Rap1a immunity proteins
MKCCQDAKVSLILILGRRRPLKVKRWRPGLSAPSGFLDGLSFGLEGRDFCPPREVTTGQGVAVVVKYIEARPKRMHERFGDLALEALKAAWPCKR